MSNQRDTMTWEEKNQPEHSGRTASEFNISAGRDKLIVNDMPEIPWKLSSPMITFSLIKEKLNNSFFNSFDELVHTRVFFSPCNTIQRNQDQM